MENVSEDAFSSFLKNELRFDVTPQPHYEFESEISNPFDSLFKNDEADVAMGEVSRPPPLFPLYPEESSLSAPEKEQPTATASESAPANIPLVSTQSFLASTPASLFPASPGPKRMSSPPANEKKGILLKAKRPVPCKEKKTKTVQYEDSSSDSASRGDVDKKKKRLERNRKSARESRRRKKEYIQRLEIQNREILQELEYYKTELARHVSKGPSNMASLVNSDVSLHKSEGPNLLEQVRAAKTTIGQLVDEHIPPIYKYMLWAAENNAGPYSKASDSNRTEEAKTAQEILCVKNGATNSKIAIRKCRSEGSDAMPSLDLVDQQRINTTHGKVREICENIQGYIKGLLEHKNGVLKEICKLDKIMQQEVFEKMTPEAFTAFNTWIEQKKHKPEMEYFKELSLGFDRSEKETDDSGTMMTRSSGPPMKRPKIF